MKRLSNLGRQLSTCAVVGAACLAAFLLTNVPRPAYAAYRGGGSLSSDGFSAFTSRVPYRSLSSVVDGGPLDEDGEEDGTCHISVQIAFNNSLGIGAGTSVALLPGSYRLLVDGVETVPNPDPNALQEIDPTVQTRLALQLAVGEKVRLKQQVTGFRGTGTARRTTDRQRPRSLSRCRSTGGPGSRRDSQCQGQLPNHLQS